MDLPGLVSVFSCSLYIPEEPLNRPAEEPKPTGLERPTETVHYLIFSGSPFGLYATWISLSLTSLPRPWRERFLVFHDQELRGDLYYQQSKRARGGGGIDQRGFFLISRYPQCFSVWTVASGWKVKQRRRTQWMR